MRLRLCAWPSCNLPDFTNSRRVWVRCSTGRHVHDVARPYGDAWLGWNAELGKKQEDNQMTIWAAFFLICSLEKCMAVGSPLFQSKEACEQSVQLEGVLSIQARWPEYKIVEWQCVAFNKKEV